MTPRQAAVSLLLLVLASAGTVQLVDPTLDEQRPATVDFTDPPAQVAADSAGRLEHVDYAYRIDLADDPDGPWEQLRVVWIEHSDREYRKVGPLGESGVVIYANDAVVFARPGEDAAWRMGYVPEVTYPAPTLTQPYNITLLRRGRATVVRENSTDLIIESRTMALKVIPTSSGRSRLHIDKQRKLVVWALFEYDVGENRTEFLRYRLIESHSMVERPSKLNLTPSELFWDILSGPVFRLE